MTVRRPFLLGIPAALGLVAGLLIGAGAVLAQEPRPAPVPSIGSGTTLETPQTLPVAGDAGVLNVGTAIAGTGTAVAGSAIAYPYFAGTPGLAPDNTIVVTGVGQADTKADGSDRASAQKTALQAALVDARTQADAIAAATHLTITGALSVSATVTPANGVMPMGASGSVVACPDQPPATGTSPGGPTLPQPVCPPEYQPTLSVAVTVAYRVG